MMMKIMSDIEQNVLVPFAAGQNCRRRWNRHKELGRSQKQNGEQWQQNPGQSIHDDDATFAFGSEENNELDSSAINMMMLHRLSGLWCIIKS